MISRADVIDVDWGFLVEFSTAGFSDTGYIDFMKMKVYYTVGSGGGGTFYRRRHIGFLGG